MSSSLRTIICCTVTPPYPEKPNFCNAAAMIPSIFSIGITASFPASPTPIMAGLLNIAPCLYQSTLKCGICGGFKLNFPSILKCGSFMFGSSHEKLKKLLILSIALFTASLAPLILSVIASFIAPNFSPI